MVCESHPLSDDFLYESDDDADGMSRTDHCVLGTCLDEVGFALFCSWGLQSWLQVKSDGESARRLTGRRRSEN